MEKNIVTTAEFMQHKDWPKLKTVLLHAICDYNDVMPLDKVTLTDRGNRFTIDINGDPVSETTFKRDSNGDIVATITNLYP